MPSCIKKGQFPFQSSAAQPKSELLPRLPRLSGGPAPTQAKATPAKEANALQEEVKPKKEVIKLTKNETKQADKGEEEKKEEAKTTGVEIKKAKLKELARRTGAPWPWPQSF